MKNLDEVFDIYQSFLDFVSRDYKYNVDFYEKVKVDETRGKESALLNFNNGFKVELSNQQNVENTAALRCWWYDEENAVEISTLDQLVEKFLNHD